MFTENKRLSLALLVAAVVLLFLVTTGSAAASISLTTTSLTFTSPSAADVVLPEIDEFATNVLGDPWDMNEATDLVYYREESALTKSQFGDGLYTAEMTSGEGSERLTLLTAGALNNAAMRIGRIGYNFPIDADHYRFLSFRVWRSNSEHNSGLVQWYADDSYTSNALGVSNGYPVPAGKGWQTYVVDLKALGIQAGERNWTGTIRELILHPYAGPGAAGSTVKLDWARLTHEDPRQARPFTINWTGSNGTPVTLYASRDNKQLDDNDILLASDLTGSSFTWQTGTVEAGTYYLALRSGSDTVWSKAAVVLHTPPRINLTKPSMTSGKEFAADVLGNAWDMSDPTDLNSQTPSWWESCVINESFTGIYRANLIPCTNTKDYLDSKLYLGHLEGISAIDTNKYRYLSFKLSHSGTQNVEDGWVARFGWWAVNSNNQIVEEVVMGRDIILFEGQQVYNVDLWSGDVVDERHPIQRSWRDSAPNRLRFDPTELHKNLLPASIELDWIRLTAMDDVEQGGTYNIEFETSNVETSDVTVYYDSDRRSANHAHIIDTVRVAPTTTAGRAASPPHAPAYSVEFTAKSTLYLPLTMDNAAPCSGNCVRWDTSDVPVGKYYICAEIADPYNSTYTCSDTPVEVK